MDALATPEAMTDGRSGEATLEATEIRLLLEAIHAHYQLDFREYAPASIRRRLWRRADAEGVTTISGLQERVLHGPEVMERLLLDLSVNVTGMFRDPSFYAALREKVVPLLRTYPFLRIWNAGCSTGEEAYSVAILLHEEGLLERSRIYATDINQAVVEKAKDGVFGLERMREYTDNYIRAGGRRTFSDYYTSAYEHASFARSLTENVVFARHNLVSDRVFNSFNLILCRNVMIYFDEPLQRKVHELLYESLETFGVLALGRKEPIRFSGRDNCYRELDTEERLYRKAH
jgi:chemotaxis protein methyltransferase CheR